MNFIYCLLLVRKREKKDTSTAWNVFSNKKTECPQYRSNIHRIDLEIFSHSC